MTQLIGTELVGHVVTYRGTQRDYYGANCVVVAYDELRGRYTLDPVQAFGPRSKRISNVRRTSFFSLGRTEPVCRCGHAVLHRLPEPVCGRCNCPDHRDRNAQPYTPEPATAVDAELTDTELFERVRTGTETVLYDATGTPLTVTVPFADYLAQRAAAAFHRV